ncbi:uncharacterized protein LOC143897981 isoform X2 [Temnothorax americanus]|uniref:uncharacterized protein LOC143897981 isoform X2 n=1 Tax=Temnothorax americanus TaxID=1964332 RepID=UPI004068CB6F
MTEKTNLKQLQSRKYAVISNVCGNLWQQDTFEDKYQSKSDSPNLTVSDKSLILQQSNYNNEEIGNCLLDCSSINDTSFIMDELMPLDNTYTLENFPEIEDITQS